MSLRLYINNLLGFMAIMAVTMPVQAQEGPSSTQGQAQKTDTKTTGDDSSQSDDNPIKTPLLTSEVPEIKAIGSSTPLPSYESFLRWGPIYLRSVELLQSYEQLSNVAGGNQGIFNQGDFLATILRTDIVYDKQLKQSRLVLEFAPRLTVINGHVSSDFLNQTLSVQWVEALSPRWTLGISNTASYESVRSLYGDYFIGVPSVTGAAVPSSFLDGAGSWLNVTTDDTLTYALSPTSSISFGPLFSYGHTSGAITTSPQGGDVYQYGGHASWQKQVARTRSVQINYFDQVIGPLGEGISYQTVNGGVSQQIGPSTIVSISAGILSAGFPGGTQWSFSGSAQAARTFGRSRGSIEYYRGVPLFSEVLSQGYSQMVDVNYNFNLSERWYLTVQGGYEDTLSTNTPNISGKFISGELSHRLASQISCYVSYAHKVQSGSLQNLLVGTVDYYLAGIRWDAKPLR